MTVSNHQQRDFWTSQAGPKWVAMQDELERLHQGMTEPLLDRAGIGAGARILDIGCGSGAVSRQAAERAGPTGAVTGIDISETILASARRLPGPEASAPIDYLLADAQTHAFAPRSFDRLVSRMGVMFFDDPLAAFANLLRSAAPGATFCAVAWRRGEENPWFGVPAMVATRHLGTVESAPHAPGPLAFADIDRTLRLLDEAGWVEMAADPLPVDLVLSGTTDDAREMFTTLGSAARIIACREATDAQVAVIADEIAEAMRCYETPDGLRVPVVMTLYSARAPV